MPEHFEKVPVNLGESLRGASGLQAQYALRYFIPGFEGYSYLGGGLRIYGTDSKNYDCVTIHPDDVEEAIRRLNAELKKNAEKRTVIGGDNEKSDVPYLPDWLR